MDSSAPDSRPVVRCERCALMQYMTRNGFCRKCREILPTDPAPSEALSAFLASYSPNQKSLRALMIALRRTRGLRQKDLAILSNHQRSEISLVESGRRDMTVGLLCSVADAFQISPQTFLQVAHPFFEDPFLIEVLFLIRNGSQTLSSQRQRSSIIGRVVTLLHLHSEPQPADLLEKNVAPGLS